MRLLLIDDHQIVTQSLKFFLSALDSNIDCVVAGSLSEATAAPGPFDMVLLDYKLPDSNGFDGLRTIRTVFNGVPVAMLSGEQDLALIQTAISEGAMGFVCKSSSPQVLIAALRLMLAGGVYLPSLALQADACSIHSSATPSNGSAIRLSDRQLEIVLKAIRGKTNKAIARELGLAEGTIKAHLSSAFRLIGVNNRTEAVFRMAELGWTMPIAKPDVAP